MAKERMTLEEALVPVEEQPYEVPENWVWVRLGSIIKVSSGDFLTSAQMDSSGDVPVYGGNGINGYHSKYNVDNTTLVIGRVGYYCGSVHLINRRAWVTDNALIAKFSEQEIDIDYLYWLLKNSNLRVNDSSTAQPVISGSKIYGIPIQIPPLKEQERISRKISVLLDKISQAKELIDEAKETFEFRRASLLHKAFTGELTAKWREENSNINNGVQSLKSSDGTEFSHINNQNLHKLPDSWKWVTIGDVTSFIGSGITPRGGQSVYQTNGIPFVRSQNVLRCKMKFDDIAYISEEINNSMKRTELKGEETLLNITGASIGRCAKFDRENSPGNVNQHVCIIRFNNEINSELPQYWINSPTMQKIIMDSQTGVTRQGLNYSQVRNLIFPLIPLKEQSELIKELKSLLDFEEGANDLLELEEQIDLIEKSILSKAFKGELGTNDPGDEPAIELLKRVLEEKGK